MSCTRRQMLKNVAGSAAGISLLSSSLRAAVASRPAGVKIGMCDWSLKRMDPTVFALARQIGLDGVQVSVGTADNNLWLRQPEVREQYLQASRAAEVKICSLALGELNQIPLMSEPRAAIWTADSIEVAKALGVRNILLAFFGTGELREENATDIRRVIEVLKELAPRAEKAGVVLGVESYLSLKGHLRILDAVASPAVQVYYDFYNSHVTKGYDFRNDLKALGRERICEVHFKEGPHMLGASGKPDWGSVVAALREIGYEGWIVLETVAPSGDMVTDTRRNLEYANNLFR